jgi:PAS domain S-box-containing protein
MARHGRDERAHVVDRELPRVRTEPASERVARCDDWWDEGSALTWVLQASGLGHWRYYYTSDRLECSVGVKVIFGLGPEDELTSFDQVQAYVHPDDRSLMDDSLEAALSDGADYVVEHRILSPSGEVRWVMVRGRVCRRGGEPLLAGIIIDITQQKRVEAERERLLSELAAERARLRTVIDQMPAAVLVGASSGELVMANRNVESVFPHAPGELPMDSLELFRSWRAHYPDGRPVPPEDRPLSRALRGEHVSSEDYFYVRDDGEHRWIRISSAPIRDERGALIGAVTIGLDVDREKRFEAERESLLHSLERSEERYRLAARATEDAIYDWDLRTDTLSVQKVFAHVPEVFNSLQSWVDQIHPDERERVVAGLRAAIDRGDRHWQDEYRFGRGDGTWLTVADRGYVDRGADGRPLRMVGAMQDVTARRRQEALERQLIGIVSHDLKNPLNTILLAAGLVAGSEDIGERAARNTIRIQGAARRATRMISDLLDFTRARLGAGIPIERRRVGLGALFRELVEETRVGHPDRAIVYEASGDLTGAFDPDRLAQVLTNLIENALAYGPPGSAARVTVVGNEDEVMLAVHNRGPAISAEILPRIFEPLQRGATAFDSSGRSVGLGLYIVKHLVEAHGGRIDVRSSDGDGTEFVVRLPRSDG